MKTISISSRLSAQNLVASGDLNAVATTAPGEDPKFADDRAGSAAAWFIRTWAKKKQRKRLFRAGLRKVFKRVLRRPYVLIRKIGESVRLNGAVIKQRSGKWIFRQICEQVLLHLRYSISPREYYMFELFDDARRKRAASYILRRHMKKEGGAYRFIKRGTVGGDSKSPVNNKADFIEWCQEANLPVVPKIAEAKRGKLLKPDGSRPKLPPTDLFIKPNEGKGGRGAERWDYHGDGAYRNTKGVVLTGRELLQRLKKLSRREKMLIQPRLVNHPEIADLNNGALATVRVLSIVDEAGQIEITNAILRMARGKNTVIDNFHAGGIAAKIDLRTGELGPASDMGVDTETGWLDRHPNTGALIVGRRIPCWPDVLALARRAHAVFRNRLLVGWDMALTPQGWILVEANSAPCTDFVQRTHREPLGDTRFGQLLAHHLARIQKK